MIFVGFFGIQDKIQENVAINSSNLALDGQNPTLIRKFRYFHIFLIPIYKWHFEYYLRTTTELFSVKTEPGEKAYEDSTYALNNWNLTLIRKEIVCKTCGRISGMNDEYCSKCGNSLK